MEPLAAMAKQLAAALNQAAESFTSVKKELAETKAALARIKKKALEDSIATVSLDNIPITTKLLIEVIAQNPDQAARRKHRTSQ